MADLFALVLAAGRAERYGSPKQLAPFRGAALVTRALRAAEAVCGPRTVLVTGHAGAAVHAACAPLAGFLVHNERHCDGLASSLVAGVAAVARVADGILLTLADQPLVGAEQLRALGERWQRTPGFTVASHYAGAPGVPAIFPRARFGELLALRGDRGAQALLVAAGDELVTLECAAAAVDIDRPRDLEALETGSR